MMIKRPIRVQIHRSQMSDNFNVCCHVLQLLLISVLKFYRPRACQICIFQPPTGLEQALDISLGDGDFNVGELAYDGKDG